MKGHRSNFTVSVVKVVSTTSSGGLFDISNITLTEQPIKCHTGVSQFLTYDCIQRDYWWKLPVKFVAAVVYENSLHGFNFERSQHHLTGSGHIYFLHLQVCLLCWR